MLRIHEILERIRIRGSIPPDPGPAIFVGDHHDGNKKLFFIKFFCLLLFEGKFTSFSKIKSSYFYISIKVKGLKEVTKPVFRIRIHFSGSGSRGWGWRPIRIRIRIQSGSRALMTKNWKKITAGKKNLIFFLSKTAIYLSLGLHKVCPSYRRSLQLTKEAIQHFKTWTLKKNFYFCG